MMIIHNMDGTEAVLTLILPITFCPENIVCILHLLHEFKNALLTTFDHRSKHYKQGKGAV